MKHKVVIVFAAQLFVGIGCHQSTTDSVVSTNDPIRLALTKGLSSAPMELEPTQLNLKAIGGEVGGTEFGKDFSITGDKVIETNTIIRTFSNSVAQLLLGKELLFVMAPDTEIQVERSETNLHDIYAKIHLRKGEVAGFSRSLYLTGGKIQTGRLSVGSSIGAAYMNTPGSFAISSSGVIKCFNGSVLVAHGNSKPIELGEGQVIDCATGKLQPESFSDPIRYLFLMTNGVNR